jgi:hypothetical protein
MYVAPMAQGIAAGWGVWGWFAALGILTALAGIVLVSERWEPSPPTTTQHWRIRAAIGALVLAVIVLGGSWLIDLMR